MKKILCIIMGILFLLPFSAHAFKLKKGQNCMDCHKLSTAEAAKLIEKAVPGGAVLEVKASPVKGIWLLDVQRGEQRGAVLLDYSKKFLISQLIPLADINKKAEVRKVDPAKISLADSLLVGAANAKSKVIVFTDPDCPYCRQLHTIIKQVVEKRKDIAFALILNPLSIHKDAPKKVQAILCSKSLAMLDDAFAGKPVPEPTCGPDAMERNKALAASLQFDGTPTLVRADGTVLSGFLPEEQLIKWIDQSK